MHNGEDTISNDFPDPDFEIVIKITDKNYDKAFANFISKYPELKDNIVTMFPVKETGSILEIHDHKLMYESLFILNNKIVNDVINVNNKRKHFLDLMVKKDFDIFNLRNVLTKIKNKLIIKSVSNNVNKEA